MFIINKGGVAMNKSAGYLRVSTDTSDQLNSLANQALIIKNFDSTVGN